ncbi:MAG TPA: hypothetical protein VHL11_01645, partial [Phototrophicaceae bacterium]|nr:hypothetical protein [Phototrophicaceae bacterium]
AAMLIVITVLTSIQSLIALLAGIIVYGVVLIALRPLSSDELAFLIPHLPLRLKRWLTPFLGSAPV